MVGMRLGIFSIKNSIIHKILDRIEGNNFYFILLVLASVALLGTGWYFRMVTGQRYIIYIAVIILAPLVPWILKTAYKKAAPVNLDVVEDGKDKEGRDKFGKDNQ